MIRLLLTLADSLRHKARRQVWPRALASGRRGEDLAHRFLQERGLRVGGRNYRARSGGGEIDLVAWERDTLVFVEVKARSTEEFGAPDRAVDREKRRALVHAAREYARRANVEWHFIRFDVVSVVLRDPPTLAHIRDAFPPGLGL